jgi:hypothetical protein
VTPVAASDRRNVIWSTSPMADNSLLPLSGDEKLALVAGLKRLGASLHSPLLIVGPAWGGPGQSRSHWTHKRKENSHELGDRSY